MKIVVKILKRLLILLVVLTLLALGVWFGNRSIETDVFSFVSPSLPAAFDGFRVAQLSDLHGAQFGEDNAGLVDAVAAQKPDIIALTGDFVDQDSEVGDVVPLVRGLTAIAPVYFVTGNHEWGSGKAQALMQALREQGVVCLENEYVRIERGGSHIFLAGIHDPNGRADQKTPEQLAAELRAEEMNPFWLLLAHRNTLFNGKYCRLGASLTLCGHAHGGVWRLPFTDGVIGTDKRPFPSFTSGFYHCTDEGCDGAWVFVSRGLGNSPHWLMRLFNHPQLAVIEFRCQ
ncbi:MAG: metallophosphoesterase [Oscillospiraceae bacterium]|nr:metallophosphoesterase [Oscillospiraceae bacterium]